MQDPEKRKALDGAREDAEMRERAEAVAAQEERERQWRVARGTATAEDLRGPIRVGPAQRDTWMTDLPEARRPNVAPQQVNVVSRLASVKAAKHISGGLCSTAYEHIAYSCWAASRHTHDVAPADFLHAACPLSA